MSKLSMEDLLKGRQPVSEDPNATRLEIPAPVSGVTFPFKPMIAGAVILVIVLAYLVYGFFTLQEGQKALYAEIQTQANELAKKNQASYEDLSRKIAASAEKISELRSDTDVIRQKAGVTQSELNQARAQVAQLREQAAQAVTQIQAQLSQKAEASQVAQIQQEAEQKIGAVNKDVGAVRTDVEETKKNLGDTQRQLVDVRDTLSSQIARNKSELEQLRRKGERDYVEFSAPKNAIITVRDIRLQLKDTDTKKSRYNVIILVDDKRLEKKDRTANEPLQFLVGKDKLRYEIVVNTVQKNAVEGYLSVPKDRSLSAERPVVPTSK